MPSSVCHFRTASRALRPSLIAAVTLCALFFCSGRVEAKTNTTTTLVSSLNPATYRTSVTFTATLSPTTATGTVTFKDGTTTLGTGTLSSGKAIFSSTTPSVGSHSITASYGGDTNDNTSVSSTLTQAVTKATTTTSLASSANPSSFGSSLTFTATLSPTAATGTVTFKDGTTTLGTGTLSSGKATYSSATLSVGSHSITASYGGDINDNTSASSTLTQTVKATTTTTLASSANPSSFGTLVTFTATLSPTAATGTVTFKDGATTLGSGTLSSGKATYSSATLSVGSHSITASYGGDTNNNTSTSSTLTQTVNKATTTTTLASSANPSSFGSSVTFTATLSPTAATGTVTFKDGTTTLGTGTLSSGKATYSSATLLVGSHSITASYGGDTNDNTSTSSTLTQTVNKATTTTTLASSASPSSFGSSVTFTATLSPTAATGTVTFKDGTSTLGTGTLSGGSATYSSSTLSVGSHSITASYGGDTNDNTSVSSTLTQTVSSTTPSITGLSPNFGPIGSIISVTGQNFGFPQGTSSITFGGWPASTTSWSTTSISAVVPQNATSGNVLVKVSGISSNGANFTVQPTPSITSLSLPSGGPGRSVTIIGTNFGLTQGASLVTFNGTVAVPCGTCWSANSITAPVPAGATTGTVVVTVNGVPSNGVNFTVAILTSVTIYPQSPIISPGNTQQFSAYGAYSDGSSQDLTSSAGWSSSAPGVASVSSAGLATAAAYGQTTVIASVGTFSRSATLTVDQPSFVLTGSLISARYLHTATTLTNGKVLVVGGVQSGSGTVSTAELYDPTSGVFSVTGPPNTPRSQHTGTLLANGMVLIAGGYDRNSAKPATAELYNPATGTFTNTGNLNVPRIDHSATLLSSGMVLIAGGVDASFNVIAAAELYDPSSGTFTLTGSFNTARFEHSATLLNSGKILIAGGEDVNDVAFSSAEIYDQVSGSFSATGNLNVGRILHTATQLANGLVLIAGGEPNEQGTTPLAAAEIYDPVAGTFALTGNLTTGRYLQMATLLNSGIVLISGGQSSGPLSSAELYYPNLGMFAPTGAMNAVHAQSPASLLNDGRVLIAGGVNSTAEFYTPTALMSPPGLISLAVSPLDPSIVAGTTQTFTCSGVFADGTAQDMTNRVTWTSSVPSIATMNATGLATAGSSGTTTVSVASGVTRASTSLSVSAVQLVSIAVTAQNTVIIMGATQQFSAIGTYNNGSTQNLTSSVIWSSSASPIATINASGLATGISDGQTLIQATLGSVQGLQWFYVAAALQSLSVTPGSGQSSIGGTLQLQAIGAYSNGNSNVTSLTGWNTSNANVATVSGGLVRGVSSGSATITATYNYFSSQLTASAAITVTSQDAPPQISWSVFPFNAFESWSHQNTTVTFTCTAGGLAIASCTSPVTVSTEGAHQVITGTVTDTAGTAVSTSITLFVDKTPPALVISSPADGTTFTSSNVAISGTISDNLSGVASMDCNGAPATISAGNFSCNIGLGVGVNVVRVEAFDVAGNVSAVLLHEILTGTLPPANSVRITPVGVNMLVGDVKQFTAVDELGRPRTDATWTVDNTALGTITVDSSPILTALAPGTITLTATVQGVSSQSQVNISSLVVFPGGTNLWSAPPVLGFSPFQIAQAMPSSFGPASYSILKSSDATQSLVQALRADGQLMWQTTLSALAGSPVSDGNGGVILMEACDSSDPLNNPLTIVDLDGGTGTVLWQSSVPATTGKISVCLLGLPKLAIRQDGAIVLAMPLQISPPLVVLDGATGQAIFAPPIPPSTLGQSTCDCFTPIGQPMVGSDGSINVEYIVRNAIQGYANNSAIWLLTMGLDGSTSSAQLSSSNVGNVWPGRVIPDGPGSILATWTNEGISNPYQAAHVSSGIVTNFNLPMAPQVVAVDPSSSLPLDIPLLLGEGDNAFVSYGGNIVSFHPSSGSSIWSYPANVMISATDVGGVAVWDAQGNMIQLDSQGNASTPVPCPACGNPTYSWSGDWYGSTSSSISGFALPAVSLAWSWAAVPGGNPSENGSFLPSVGQIEGEPLFAMPFWGPTCKLGTEKVALNGDALTQYNNLKQGLLNGGYLTCPSCTSFFAGDPTRNTYFSQLATGLNRQVAYDGLQTNISMYDAGMWTEAETSKPTFFLRKVIPVCGNFEPWKGVNGTVRPSGKTWAVSQLQLPATDVYINTKPKILKTLTQGTILHETLHNITGMFDEDLELLLGLTSAACSDGTICITRILVKNGCTAPN